MVSMAQYIEIVFRTLVAFVVLLLIARALGKQTIAQMTFFDFSAAITLGSIAGGLSYNTSVEFLGPLLALVLFAAITFLTQYISLKSRKARKLLAGDPTVVIQNGKILENNMKKMRYSLDYLNQELREKNVFDIREVLFAILEVNGELTVLKKPQYRNVTRQDFWIQTKPEKKLSIELIMDRQVIKKNLHENQLTDQWLETELSKSGLRINDVFYAVLGADGQLYIDTYNDHIQSPIDKD